MSDNVRFADYFSPQVRRRGRAYAREGRVHITRIAKTSVEAVVSGGQDYDVMVSHGGATVEVSCSCPYARDSQKLCKHIWATLVEGRQRQILPAFGPTSALVELARHGDDSADDPGGSHPTADDGASNDPLGESAGHRPDESVTVIGPATETPRTHLPARRGQWKHVIASALERSDVLPASSPSATITDGEILYQISVPESLQAKGLVVELLQRRRKQNGDWGKPRSFRIAPTDIPTLPHSIDRRILTLLDGARSANGSASHRDVSTYEPGPDKREIPMDLAYTLLPLMCESGRSVLRKTTGKERTPLAWDESPWHFRLEVAWFETADDPTDDSESTGDATDRDPAPSVPTAYVLNGSLRRGDERLPLDAPVLLLAGGLVITEERVAPLNDYKAFGWIALLRREGTIVVPAKDGDDLVTRILRSPHHPPLDLPDELRFETVRVVPTPRLSTKPIPGQRHDTGWLSAELSFQYDNVIVDDETPGREIVQPERRRVFARDADAERMAAERLRELPIRRVRRNLYAPFDADHIHEGLELRAQDLAAIVRALLTDGWHVEASGRDIRPPGQVRVGIASGIDWFELRGEVNFGEQSASISELMAALKRGEETVVLGDGSFGLLPQEWLRKHLPLVQMGTTNDDHVRFRKSQVAFLNALLAAQPDVDIDEGFERAREAITNFDGIEPIDPPRGFTGTLRDYQRDGLGWMRFLRTYGFGGCLADDMGLGKTVQVLALLESRRRKRPGKAAKPSLVVVPRSLLFNWQSEAARFTPRLKVLEHSGPGREKSIDAFRDRHLILTTYGTLRRDAAFLKDVDFDYVILDEAQAIKNANTASAKAARLLRADHRLALSGTPIENHIGEIWSLFEFLDPGLLGTASAFNTLQDGKGNPDSKGREMIARALRPMILRRTKNQVARELPEKVEQSLYCELLPKQREFYDELRNHYRASLGARIASDGLRKSKILVLEALLRLRQAACHPGLVDGSKTDLSAAKLDLLMEQLTAVVDEGHKVLVFSQFTSFLALLRAQLDDTTMPYAYLDGRTRKRNEQVERFQTDPDCKLFLISLKAGGLGLNLTAAEYVYLLDPWWNPAVEAQAIDRTHRIGQTRRVFAYRLIAKDTVEEKILELQQTKRDLADSIIRADNALIRNLKREDLELLLS